MKAISIKEPWSSMIKDGKKTIETRVWKTNYRGEILLCASRYPQSSISGKAFAVAKLVDVKPMVREDEIRACCEVYPRAYSWFLKDIQLIEPFDIKGQLRLFEVPSEKIKRMSYLKSYITENLFKG